MRPFARVFFFLDSFVSLLVVSESVGEDGVVSVPAEGAPLAGVGAVVHVVGARGRMRDVGAERIK